MPEAINTLDVVALLTDMPQHGLVRGQIGTIVECLAPDIFEVEFSDDQGRAYALLPLRAADLMRLHIQPVRAA